MQDTRLVAFIIALIRTVERLATTLFQSVGQMSVAFFQYLVPAIAPLAPAGLLGMTVYLGLATDFPYLARVAIAGAFAFGVEGAGVLAAKSASRFYYDWREAIHSAESGQLDRVGVQTEARKFCIAVALAVGYLVTGITMVVLLEQHSAELRALAVGGFIVVGLVYSANALWTESESAAERRRNASAESGAIERIAAEAAAAEARAAAEYERDRAAAERAHQHEMERRRLYAELRGAELAAEVAIRRAEPAADNRRNLVGSSSAFGTTIADSFAEFDALSAGAGNEFGSNGFGPHPANPDFSRFTRWNQLTPAAVAALAAIDDRAEFNSRLSHLAASTRSDWWRRTREYQEGPSA